MHNDEWLTKVGGWLRSGNFLLQNVELHRDDRFTGVAACIRALRCLPREVHYLTRERERGCTKAINFTGVGWRHRINELHGGTALHYWDNFPLFQAASTRQTVSQPSGRCHRARGRTAAASTFSLQEIKSEWFHDIMKDYNGRPRFWGIGRTAVSRDVVIRSIIRP